MSGKTSPVSTVMHVRCPDRLPEQVYRLILERMAELSPSYRLCRPVLLSWS